MANVVSGNIGAVNACRSISEPRDAWEIFFAPVMLLHIIHNTNEKTENLRAKFLLIGYDITSVPYAKNTRSSEILAFIGLLYLRSLLGLTIVMLLSFFMILLEILCSGLQ